MKSLDMADKYPPAESFDLDDEPTIRVQVPNIPVLATVGEEDEDFDLHGDRDTIPCPPSYPECVEERGEKRYPGVGLLLCLVTGLAFWGAVAYFVLR